MSSVYLIEAKPENAELALCEYDETYVSLEAVEAHIAEGHRITWLRQEVA